MSTPSPCPEIDRWQALLGDALAPEQRTRFERHLESCPACQDHLDRAAACGEPLRRLATQLGDPTQAPADPALAQLVDRLLQAKAPDPPAPADEADLYFLRPSDRAGVLGTLGGYEVLEVIGQGGMGVVLKAFDPGLNRYVAIKVVAAALAGSALARRRFTREAQAAAAICHDHVVPVYGVSEADGLPYLVMQYVAGESLQDRLDRTGPLEVEEVVRIGLQTASGLAAAHAQGLIHRDIKPANLLLENGVARVKITDFGLARMADDIGLTGEGVLAGTPEYMAPEQARGEAVDHRADLFSLGSVLYAMCTGRPPFRGPSAVAVLRKVTDEPPAPPRSLNPSVPVWLETLIILLLAKSPGDRPRSAAAVAELLESYLAHLRQPRTVPAPPLPRPRGPRGGGRPAGIWPRLRSLPRRPAVLLTALALGLLGLALAFGLSGGAGQVLPPNQTTREYYHSFKGDQDITEDFEWDGLDPQACLKFEPEGLRIALPEGHPGKRMGTGLSTTFGVKGDFEITISFEVLKEPKPADAGEGTGGYVWVDLDTPALNRALLSRSVQEPGRTRPIAQAIASQGIVPSGIGAPVWPQALAALRVATLNAFAPVEKQDFFGLWFLVSDPVSGQRRAEDVRHFPTAAMKGRMRLVRKGAVVSYYAAKESSDTFTYLFEHPFGTEDVKAVRIGGLTGGPRASLDFRITDLRIRSGSFTDLADTAQAGPGKRLGNGWLFAGLAIGVGFAGSLALAVWLVARQRRQGRNKPAPAGTGPGQPPPEGAPAAVTIPCSSCGKKLKVSAALAGKKVRCPGCRELVFVPSPKASQA